MHFDFTLLQHKNTSQKVGKIRGKNMRNDLFFDYFWLIAIRDVKWEIRFCQMRFDCCFLLSCFPPHTMTITINICFRRQSLIPKNRATFVSCPIAFAVRNGIKNSPSLCRNFRLSYYRHLIRSFDSSPIFDSCHTSRVSTLIKWY